MKNRFLKFTAAVLAVVIIITIFTIFQNANRSVKAIDPMPRNFSIDTAASEYDSYISVKEDYLKNNYIPAKINEVPIDLKNAKAAGGELKFSDNIGDKKYTALVWDNNAEYYDFDFIVPEAGLYNISCDYYVLEGSSAYAERGFMIDGKYPFAEAQNLRFTRYYKDNAEPVKNTLGDEIRPKQVEIKTWNNYKFIDNQGLSTYPFEIYLEAGKHTLRLNYINEALALSNLKLTSPQTPKKYIDVLEDYKSLGYKNSTKHNTIQAESTAVKKSSPTLRRENNGDPKLVPTSYNSLLLNIIGDYNWRKGNQSIEWSIYAPEEGLYKIAMRSLQCWGDGLPSHRQIRINGDIPFSEVSEYTFGFDRDWKVETISNSKGEPYLFHLKQGENIISMDVKVGSEVAEISYILNNSAISLSSLMRKIIMLTGNNPDINYDYELDKNIKELKPTLKEILDKLDYSIHELTRISVKAPSGAHSLKSIRTQIEKLYKKPDIIPKSFNDLNNALSVLGNLSIALKEQPLSIDEFYIANPEKALDTSKSNFISRTYSTFVNFAYSFIKDYNNVATVTDSSVKINDEIEIWITRGKEWGELLKELADEQFTKQTGTRVKINILPASAASAGAVNPLMLAINSGRAPDIAMGQPSGQPAEYAFRDAVLDLKKFPDFNEIKSRFNPDMLTPYTVNNGIYAIPDTMNFRVMFYRKDILNEYNIKIPETWDELYSDVFPKLNQNGMQFFFAAIYDIFLYQNNGQFFKDNGRQSALDSPEAYRGFKELCELYTSYGVPIAADFFNRFRTGEIPIGIGDYNLYTYITAAAPELSGLWGIAEVPGHMQPDGTINKTVGPASIDSSIILKDSKNPDSAWRFLKWWSSKDVQIEYARNIEAQIGIQARWTSANLEAFMALPWDNSERKVLSNEMKWTKETPVYLGSYFSGRHVGNAFNRVIISNYGVRDSLELAVKDINKELKRKREQFGIK